MSKAVYPYHGGQPKAGAGAGYEKGGRLINGTPPSTGNSTANRTTKNPTQAKTPPVRMKK